MAQNKKHHYVPKFYLKRFSSEGKSIHLFNIPNRRKVLHANLKNQCYRNYFYGKAPDVESAIGDIEGATAHVLRLIDRYGAPPPPISAEHFTLLLYVLTQYGRTAYSADTLNEMNDRLAKHLFAARAKAEGINLDSVTIGIQDVGRYSLGMVTQHYPLVLDLHYKLLVNASDTEFITSDNPVVLYNQLFSFRSYGSNTGLACKGLQIVFPVGPKSALLFYDSDVYNVGNRGSSVVQVSNPRDIYELNTLQICSSEKNIYFSNPNFNIEALYRKAKPFLRTRKSNLDVISREHTRDEKRELVATSREDIRTRLTLTFVRLNRASKIWRDKFRKAELQPAVVVRNDQICDDHEEFMTLVKDGKYRPSDFLNFLQDKYEQS